MRRRDLVVGLLLAGVAPAAWAQQTAKVYRIAIVSSSTPVFYMKEKNEITGPFEVQVSFRERLADRGYVDGRNLVIEERFGEGHPERLPKMFSDLVSEGVDVLVAPGSQQAVAAKRQTATVPIVFISSDPIGLGLVSSLAHPEGNLTGVFVASGEYSAKWLYLLKEAAPQVRHVGVLWNPDNPGAGKQVNSVRQAATALGVEVAVFAVRYADIEDSLAAVAGAAIDGLVVTDDGVILQLADRIGAFAAEHKLPTLAGFRPREGILMSYSFDQTAVGRRVADYVDRILKGARPADLPVEQAREFVLRINLKTAKNLGLTIPFPLLAGADEVIE
jgi:ABC-type uncharacterized transport system substrate-binding protein